MDFHNSTSKSLEGSDWWILQPKPFPGITVFTPTFLGLCYKSTSSARHYGAVSAAFLGSSLFARLLRRSRFEIFNTRRVFWGWTLESL
jgi:hypothetical protein